MTSPVTTPDDVLALMDAERANFLAQVARIPDARHAQQLAELAELGADEGATTGSVGTPG